MAPEMLARQGYGRAADYWSLGCIAFEMLSGLPPFQRKRNEGSKDLFRKIMSEKVKMPSGASAEACKLLKGLLNRNVLARLGTAKSTMFETGGVAGLKAQRFFSVKGYITDWDLLEKKQMTPPENLSVEGENDLQHFHSDFTNMTLPRSVVEMNRDDFHPRRVESDLFRGFSFIQQDFELPQRDEMTLKTYWEAQAEGDGESVSDVASSKVEEPTEATDAQPEKKKRPPRKRKKKNNANQKDGVESVPTTPAPSTVGAPSSNGEAEEDAAARDLDAQTSTRDTATILSANATGEEKSTVANAQQSTQSNEQTGKPSSSSNNDAMSAKPSSSNQQNKGAWSQTGQQQKPITPLTASPRQTTQNTQESESWQEVTCVTNTQKTGDFRRQAQTSSKPTSPAWETVGSSSSLKTPSRTNGGQAVSSTPNNRPVGWQTPSQQQRSSLQTTRRRPVGVDSEPSTDWRQHAMSPRAQQRSSRNPQQHASPVPPSQNTMQSPPTWPSLDPRPSSLSQSASSSGVKMQKPPQASTNKNTPPQKLQGAWAARAKV